MLGVAEVPYAAAPVQIGGDELGVCGYGGVKGLCAEWWRLVRPFWVWAKVDCSCDVAGRASGAALIATRLRVCR